MTSLSLGKGYFWGEDILFWGRMRYAHAICLHGSWITFQANKFRIYKKKGRNNIYDATAISLKIMY